MMWPKTQIDDLSKLLEKHFAIRCDSSRISAQMSSLADIQRRAGFTKESDFINFLRFSPKSKEMLEVAECFLIHETYFFREFKQLQVFSEIVLPELVEHKSAQGDVSFNVWSAACSTGEEAYTLAIILNEMLDRRQFQSIRVLGTDLDRGVIDHAKKGVYTGRTLKDVPAGYFAKYFVPQEGDKVKVSLSIQGMCDFRTENLLAPPETLTRKFDVIFCRNAFIYFSDENKKLILDSFFSCLSPNGILVIGSSDSINKANGSFSSLIRQGFTFYRRGVYAKETVAGR